MTATSAKRWTPFLLSGPALALFALLVLAPPAPVALEELPPALHAAKSSRTLTSAAACWMRRVTVLRSV